MAEQFIEYEIRADNNEFIQKLKDSEKKARDTSKALDHLTRQKLQLNIDYWALKVDEAKKQLKSLDKDSREAMLLRLDLRTFQNQTTEAKRMFNNYTNTWETWISRLQSKFDWLATKLWWTNTIAWRTIQSIWQWFTELSSMVWWLITKVWLLAVGIGALNIWARALALWDKLEQANISFESMLWSAEKAKQLLYELAVFAKWTPFELIWLRDTAKQLIAFWISADQIIPTLKALWDVSAWLSVPIQQIAYAYWQVKVAGRLMWWELMQFTNAWVPMIEYLSKVMWVAQSEIKQMVSEWEVWFSDVQKAFALMTSEGERFWNLMEKQMPTQTWLWSNFKDEVNLTLESIWTKMLPFSKGVIKILSWILKAVKLLWTWFVVSFTFMNWIIWKFVIDWIAYLANFIWFFANIKTNLWILVDNFWIAFDNLPWAMAKWLDKAIEKFEQFINFLWKWIKKVDNLFGWALSSALWQKWWFQDVTLWRIWNKYWSQPQFKSFQLWETAGKLSWAWDKYLAEQLSKIDKMVEGSFDNQKELNTELTIDELNNTEKVSKAKSWALKKDSDEKEKAIQKEKDDKVRFANEWEKIAIKKADAEKEREKKKQETLEKWKDIIKDYYNEVVDGVEKSKDKIDDFKEKIEETSEKIKDLKKELQESQDNTGVSLAERKLEIEEKINELKNDNPVLSKNYVDQFDTNTLNQNLNSTFAWWLTWKDILEAKKLYEELDYIKQNANLISEENSKIAEDNESQRLVREAQRKQQEIQDKIALAEQEKADLQLKVEAEQVIYDWLDQYRRKLETNFTTFLKWEADTRINELERIRLKAIATANALVKAWITTSASNANNALTTTNNTSSTTINNWNTQVVNVNVWSQLVKTAVVSGKLS